MNNKSRTENSKINILYGVFYFFTSTFLSFLVRTVFIKFLDISYLGINGLYSNILQLLSLSELGLSSIALFMLYKPISEKNYSRVLSLIKYYSRIYKFISLIILILGISLCPFLKFFIDSDLPFSDLVFYYLLFVLNTAFSYVGISYQFLINANQNVYLIKNVNLIFSLLQNILQLIILIYFQNYYLYLIIHCCCTLLMNFTLYTIAKRKYNFLREKCVEELDTKSKKSIISSIKTVFLYKLSVVIINSTDNIFISVLLGTSIVGYYSNYAIVIGAISSFINMIISSVSSSIGNLNATEKNVKKVDVFYKLLFFMQWIVSIISICLIILMNDLIKFWLGEQYILSTFSLIIIVMNFYVSNIINPVWMYRESMGLFKEVKYLMLWTALLNIFFSWILGKLLGLPGIFLATILSRLFTTVWREPIILLKHKFNSNVFKYYFVQVKQFLIFGVVLFILYFIFNKIVVYNLFDLFTKSALLFIVSNSLYIMIFFKDKNFLFYKNLMLKFLKKQ